MNAYPIRKENKRTDNVIEQQSEQKIPHFNTRFEFFKWGSATNWETAVCRPEAYKVKHIP